MQDKNGFAGNMSMLGYAAVTAFSSMLIHHTNQQVSPLLSAFYTFLFCLIFYGIIAIGLFKKITCLRTHWLAVILLNITTAVCWICTFFALKYLPAELFLFIYLCAMTIASSIIYKSNWLNTLLFIVGLVGLSLTYHVRSLPYAFALSFLGGASGTIYSIFSKRLTAHFTTWEILALRFYLTVVITFLANVYLASFVTMNSYFYLNFALLSLVSVIVPLILFQLGIKYLPVTQAMAYLPLAPILAYAINSFNQAQLNLMQLAAVLVLSGLMFFNIKNTKRGKSYEGDVDRRERWNWLRAFRLFTE